MAYPNGQLSYLQRHRGKERSLDADQDPIESCLSYFNDAQDTDTCKICHRQSTLTFSEPSPTFMLRSCYDWFHKACLTSWLNRDSATPIDNCPSCQDLHYRVRFKGPLIISLNDYFATSDLPYIRSRPSSTTISKRIQNVEDEAKRPMFGDIMEFCEEPEQMHDGLGIVKSSKSRSLEAAKARYKQADLLKHVLKHRRFEFEGHRAGLKGSVSKGRSILKERLMNSIADGKW